MNYIHILQSTLIDNLSIYDFTSRQTAWWSDNLIWWSSYFHYDSFIVCLENQNHLMRWIQWWNLKLKPKRLMQIRKWTKNGQKSRGKLSSEKNKTSKYHIVTLISLCNVQNLFQIWIEIIIHHFKNEFKWLLHFLYRNSVY